MRDLQKICTECHDTYVAMIKNRDNRIEEQNRELTKLRKVAAAAKRVMDAVTSQPQDVKERNITLAFLDATLAELEGRE